MPVTIPYLSSIDDILERLLSIDFYRDLVEDSNYNLNQIKKRIKWDTPLNPLPSHINSVEDYHSSFFSLFMIECLEIISQAKYNDLTFPCQLEPKYCQISGVFGYVTFCYKDPVPDFCQRDLVCLFIRKQNFVSIKRHFSIISNGIDENTESNSLSLSHPIYEDSINHAIGYLQSISKNTIVFKILLTPPSFATPQNFDDRDLERLMAIQNRLRTLHTFRPLSNLKGDQECWFVSKLISLTTILREFNGLCMLNNMRLKDYLLTDIPPSKNTVLPDKTNELILDFDVPEGLKKAIESNYNSAQLSAISNSLISEGISLIQGPPGTGKTTTIIGIVSLIIHSTNPISNKKNFKNSQSNNVYKINHINNYSLLNDSDDTEDDKITFDELVTGKHYDYFSKPHSNIYNSFNSIRINKNNVVNLRSDNRSKRRILICAPSNAAIDEIVKRLVSPDGGIFDSKGRRYNPTVTRVGPNYHEDLAEYSLETKLMKRMSVYNVSNLKGDRRYSFKSPTTINNILLNSEIVCSTLSGCGSRELYGLINCFDTLIIDEATQAVELSTLIPFHLGFKRAILVGDPCQLSATVCSKVAIQLKYDQSMFKRLQMCGYPVNLLNLQYRMDPLIARFPSMYFYQNKLINAKVLLNKPEDDWRQFPLFRPTVFFAIDSHESRIDTSYVNEMEVDLVCQLLEMLIEVLSSTYTITLEEISRKIAVISPYAAQVEILKSKISERINLNTETIKVVYSSITPSKSNQIYVSTVDGFQGMEKDIIIFSAVRTNYVGNKRALNARIEDLTSPSILTIDSEPHDPKELKKFNNLTKSYLNKIAKKTPDLSHNLIDASFIADRRRINVAITRACSNLLIVGNPRFLLDHKHWSELYNHYAMTGSIFICKTVNNTLDPNYLRNWSKQYLKKAPDRQKEFMNNKYLVKFVNDLMS